MKFGYMLTPQSSTSQDSAVDHQGGPNCRGRCYLPRICSQLGFQRNRSKPKPAILPNEARFYSEKCRKTKPGTKPEASFLTPLRSNSQSSPVKPSQAQSRLNRGNQTKSKVFFQKTDQPGQTPVFPPLILNEKLLPVASL